MSSFCECFVALYLDAPRLSLCQSKGLIACPFSTLLPVETQNVALLLNRWSQAKQINRGKYIRAVRLGCYRFMCHVSFLSNNLACARDLSQVLGPGQDAVRFLSTAQALNSVSRVTGFPFPVLLVPFHYGAQTARPGAKTYHQRLVEQEPSQCWLLGGKNCWRIYTHGKSRRVSSKAIHSSRVEGAEFLSTDSEGFGILDGGACQKHLDDIAITDSFRLIEREGVKALQICACAANRWEFT